MKTLKLTFVAAIIAIVGIVGFIGCDNGGNKDEPRSDYYNGTTGNLFDTEYSVIVEGKNLTATEWETAESRLVAVLNSAYTAGNGLVKDLMSEVSSAIGSKIILEKNPTDYTNWKTTGDGKTLYINFDKLDTIQSKLAEAYNAMYEDEATNG